jgi:hypothetical protein
MTNGEAGAPKREAVWLQQRDQDTAQLKRLEGTILKSAGGQRRFKKAIPQLLSRAIDEVIDSPRTGRSALDETKMNERIYLGVKVRVQVRGLLGLPKGRTLDFLANGAETSIRSTIRQTWSIPPTIVGNPCILIKSDLKRSVCSVGAIVVREEMLSPSKGPSCKRAISRAGLAGIRWILRDEPFPDFRW